jgi:hypothetical protein
MKDHLRSLPFALALTLAPLAYAQAATVFDSTTMVWTAASQYSSQNADGTTTIATPNDPSQPNSLPNTATDYYSLGSAVHTGSGTWTLTVIAQQNIGTTDAGSTLTAFGFGNFSNTSTLLSQPAGVGGPYVVDDQYQASLGAVTHGGSLHSGGSSTTLPGTLLNAYYAEDLAKAPPLTEGAKTTYQVVLNTNGPAWTLQFKVNGVAMQFNEYADAAHTQLIAPDLTTLTYGSTLPSINGVGFGAGDYSDQTIVFSENLTNDTVAAVPEPSTWAMMVLGFAGVGLFGYRHTRRNGGLNVRFA